MTPYGDKNLNKHLLRKWLGVTSTKPWSQQMLTIYQWGLQSQEMFTVAVLDISLKIIYLRLCPYLPGVNETIPQRILQ